MQVEEDGKSGVSGSQRDSEERTESHTSWGAKSGTGERTGRRINRIFFLWAVIALAGFRGFAATDVLFLIDTTGSMSGLNNFKTVLVDILSAIDANSLCPETIKYGVADYRNYTDGGNYTAYGVNLVQPFTPSIQSVQSAINGLSANGGGDLPESQLKAMISITSNWLTSGGDLGFGGRIGAQRILIWTGDAPGHIAGDEPASSGPPPAGYYPSLDDTIDALTTQGITVFALNSAHCNAGLNELYNGVNHDLGPKRQQAREITAATGGKLYCNVGSGGQDIAIDIIGALTCFSFSKDDGIEPNDCIAPDQEITYILCWSNDSSQTIYDAYIIDWLPDGVDYPAGQWQLDPNDFFNPIPPDASYDPDTHSYVWEVGTIAPNGDGCVELTVTVNEKAVPGGILHNAAELYGTVYDPNSQTLVERRITRISRDTRVCCYVGTVEELYVDYSAINGTNLGLNWPNAFVDLQDALEYARSSICAQVHSIYVAQGTYSPGELADDSFVLPDGVSVYGGFPTGGCDFANRNPKRYQTLLTGKIDDMHRNDNIVTMGDNTLLNGFTVSDASIDGSGVYGSGVDFIVETCIIQKNWAYGAYIENGNATFRWCIIRNNESDGIYHEGEGFELIVENCWIRQSGQYGINCIYSAPTIKNSIVSESDLATEGRAGIYMVNPTYTPILHNLTVAHNKAVGVARIGSTLPEMKNCIVYHNGGPALAGFTADQAASYSCIQDCNSVNNNISIDPMFAYFDPNNVRIMVDSPCHDSGLTLSENYTQFDMDNRDRVLGSAVDRGAYEIECGDTANSLDWNADGVVNYLEFEKFSRAWMTYDPNNSLCDPNNPNFVSDPNSINFISQTDKERFNPSCDLDGDLDVDLADLEIFTNPLNGNWLWVACWRLDLQPEQLEQMMMSLAPAEGIQTQSLSRLDSIALKTSAIVPEKPIRVQIIELKDSINFLEQLWWNDSSIQQEIDADQWRQFMNAVYDSLLELQTDSIRIE